jgi:hypothetical protein
MKIPLSERIKAINTDKNSLILTNGIISWALEKPFLDAMFDIYFYNCTSRTTVPTPLEQFLSRGSAAQKCSTKLQLATCRSA